MSTDSSEEAGVTEDLHRIAEQAISHALQLGASQVELVVRQGFRRAIEIRNSRISGSQQQSQSGVGVRVYFGNKLGISSNTLVTRETVMEAIEKAVKLAKLSPEDKNFVSLQAPVDRVPTHISDLYDKEIENMQADDFIDIGNSLIDGGLSVETEGKLVLGGQVSASATHDIIMNSLGVDVLDSFTSLVAYASNAISIDPTNVGSGFEVFLSRVLVDQGEFREIGSKATEKAKATLGAKEIRTNKLPVLFDHRATYQTIQSIIGDGVNGTKVMLGTSYFADKIGHELGVEGLTVIDNPHVPGGYSSTPVDAEGTPTVQTAYMERGVLMNYATNSYDANRLGIENNAHAQRMGFGKPMTGIWQLHISPGEDDFSAMLEDMREGIFMESGIGPARGSQNISAKINRGFYVRDGEIQHAVKNTMLGSDVFSFLKGIIGMSKDLRVEFGHQSPAILIDEMRVSGIGQSKKSGPVMSI